MKQQQDLQTIYFAKNIKQIRLKRNMSQRQFAKFLGVSPATTGIWERANACPSEKTLKQIAKMLNVPTKQLIVKDDSQLYTPHQWGYSNFKQIVDNSPYEIFDIAAELNMSEITLTKFYDGKTFPRLADLIELSDLYQISIAQLEKPLPSELLKSLNISEDNYQYPENYPII